MHSHNHETQVRLLDLTVSCVRCAVAQTARRPHTRAAIFRATFLISKQFAGFFSECLQLTIFFRTYRITLQQTDLWNLDVQIYEHSGS